MPGNGYSIVSEQGSGLPDLEIGVQAGAAEREQAEVDLGESETKFRLLTEAAFEGIAVLEGSHLVEVSAQFAELFGYTQEDLLGRGMGDLAAPEARAELLKKIAQRYDQPYESLFRRKDGSHFPAEVCGKNYRHRGRERRITAVRDITERKQAEETLRRRTEQLDALQALFLDITVSHGLTPLLETLVERAARLLGAPSGGLYLCEAERRQVRLVVNHKAAPELVGTVLPYGEGAAGVVAQTGEPLLVADYRAWEGRAPAYEGQRCFRAVLAAPMLWRGRVLGVIDIVHTDGSARFTDEDLGLLMLFANQAAIAVENARLFEQAQREITERKRLEQQSEERRLYLEGVLACAPDAIVTLDNHHLVQEWNWGAEELFGFSRQEAFGRNIDDLIAAPDARTFEEATGYTGQILAGKPVPATEAVRYRKDGRPVRVILAGAPILVGDALAGVVAVYHDITELKRVEDQVRRQTAELEAAVVQLRELDRLKSEFMQSVSHELRTPLSLIWGYAHLLESGELGELLPDQRGPIETMARQTRTLSALVEDITLLLATEARSLPREPVALDDLVRSAVVDFQLVASQADLTLCVDVASDMPWVLGAPVYLRRVLENLIDNAVKFTPAGGTISVRLWQQDEELVIQVADTGIGIAPEEQERIFARFYQVDGTTRRRYGGVGLGLALVKEIVELYGGTVSLTSRVGEGSTFTICLPVLEEVF